MPQQPNSPPQLPEALFAVVGVTRIIDDDRFRITVADKEQAEMLPREIRRACNRFCEEDDGPQKIEKMKVFDYAWALNHITDAMDLESEPPPPPALPGLDPELLAEIAGGFKPEDHDLAAGFMVIAQRIIPYLHSILPIRTQTTMSRTVNFDPSDTEIARFRRAYDVATDPMVVLRDLENGTLVSDQIRHLVACYPDMYNATKQRLGLAMADAMARKKSWELPWRKERLVQVVYQTDTFSPELAKDLQASFGKADQPTQGGAPSKATGKTATMFQSQTQATAEGDLRK